jgi:hypothetical protein
LSFLETQTSQSRNELLSLILPGGSSNKGKFSRCTDLGGLIPLERVLQGILNGLEFSDCSLALRGRQGSLEGFQNDYVILVATQEAIHIDHISHKIHERNLFQHFVTGSRVSVVSSHLEHLAVIRSLPVIQEKPLQTQDSPGVIRLDRKKPSWTLPKGEEKYRSLGSDGWVTFVEDPIERFLKFHTPGYDINLGISGI